MTYLGCRSEQFNRLEQHGVGSRQALYHDFSLAMSDCGSSHLRLEGMLFLGQPYTYVFWFPLGHDRTG